MGEIVKVVTNVSKTGEFGVRRLPEVCIKAIEEQLNTHTYFIHKGQAEDNFSAKIIGTTVPGTTTYSEDGYLCIDINTEGGKSRLRLKDRSAPVGINVLVEEDLSVVTVKSLEVKVD